VRKREREREKASERAREKESAQMGTSLETRTDPGVTKTQNGDKKQRSLFCDGDDLVSWCDQADLISSVIMT